MPRTRSKKALAATVPYTIESKQMSSANSNQSNGGPNRGGRRGSRGRKKINSGGGGGVVDQRAWRLLDKQYREWLVLSGIAIHATAFNAISIETRISARSAYDAASAAAETAASAASAAAKTAATETALTTLLRLNLISQSNPYAAISDSHDS
eukprot:scaffold4210_cov55-Attheya_sp.AAC.1